MMLVLLRSSPLNNKIIAPLFPEKARSRQRIECETSKRFSPPPLREFEIRRGENKSCVCLRAWMPFVAWSMRVRRRRPMAGKSTTATNKLVYFYTQPTLIDLSLFFFYWEPVTTSIVSLSSCLNIITIILRRVESGKEHKRLSWIKTIIITSSDLSVLLVLTIGDVTSIVCYVCVRIVRWVDESNQQKRFNPSVCPWTKQHQSSISDWCSCWLMSMLI